MPLPGLAFDEVIRDHHGCHIAHPCAIASDEAPDDLCEALKSLSVAQRYRLYRILAAEQQRADTGDTRAREARDDGPEPFPGMPVRGGSQIPRGAFDERPRGSFSDRFPETAHVVCLGGGLRKGR